MTRRAIIVALAAVAAISRPAAAQKLESLWYSTSVEQSTQSFLANADHIAIVSPQVFALDTAGNVTGAVDPRIIARAKRSGTKVVPLVMNPGFDQPLIHHIITTPEVAARAAANIATLCHDGGFDGIQLDIENVNVADRDAFTAFARATADRLHAVGCSASAAVVPRASDDPGPTSYHKWMFENWRGAYDYKALADALDFISYMTYAQHTGGSTPGPVAGYPWMEACLRFALAQGVPPEKISLGIPSYSDYWYPVWDEKSGSRMRGSDVGYARVNALLDSAGVKSSWDDHEKAWTASWDRAGVYEHLWIEDAKAFAVKLDLARRYHLRGYSVWVLGSEDPAVWALR